MAAGGHFGCPNFTFDRISSHFKSIRNFIFFWNFWQNDWRRPFWMSEIHFRSHFWPFQIDRQLYLILEYFLTKWLLADILDDQNPRSIAILAISDRYRIFFRRPFWMSENHFESQFRPFQINRPFWMSEIHFRSHFWPFQIDTQLYFFDFFWQNGRRWPFWMGRQCQLSNSSEIFTSPPEGVARYCFHPVCLSVCVCVCLCICVSGQYFGILFLGY